MVKRQLAFIKQNPTQFHIFSLRCQSVHKRSWNEETGTPSTLSLSSKRRAARGKFCIYFIRLLILILIILIILIIIIIIPIIRSIHVRIHILILIFILIIIIIINIYIYVALSRTCLCRFGLPFGGHFLLTTLGKRRLLHWGVFVCWPHRFCNPPTALLIIITILIFIFILIVSIFITFIIPIILIILIIGFVLIIVVINSFLLPALLLSSVSFIVLVSNLINIKRLALFVTCSNTKKPRETVAAFRLHLAHPPLRLPPYSNPVSFRTTPVVSNCLICNVDLYAQTIRFCVIFSALLGTVLKHRNRFHVSGQNVATT